MGDAAPAPNPRRSRPPSPWQSGRMTPDGLGRNREPVLLDLPFRGSWLARNSPARRVPSHGTRLYGTAYAIDFVAVDERGLPAPRTWRTALSVEPAELFRGFGQPVLAPAAGRVVAAHDGEVDHVARRSQLTLLAYAVGQPDASAAVPPRSPATTSSSPSRRPDRSSSLAHLRQGSLRVVAGDAVASGDVLGGAATPATAPSRTSTSRSRTRSTGHRRGACRCSSGVGRQRRRLDAAVSPRSSSCRDRGRRIPCHQSRWDADRQGSVLGCP